MESEGAFCGILGTAYCGSTMFSYILGSSNDIFSTGELILGYERYRCANVWHRGDWTKRNLSRAEKGMKHVEDYPCNFWTEEFASKLRDAGVAGRNKLLKSHALKVLDKKIVLNPDKAPKWFIKSIRAGDDVDKFIVLFKKPEAYCFSFEVHKRQQGGKWLGKTRMERISAACEIYEKFYKTSFKIIEENDIPAVFVSYESFAENPHKQTEEICEKIGARYSDDMISYWNNRDKLHMSPSGNRGAHIQFLERDEYRKYWAKRLTPDSDDNSYFEEHANWFLDNYHNIKVDEKWKENLKEDEIDFIKNQTGVSELYSKMSDLAIKS